MPEKIITAEEAYALINQGESITGEIVISGSLDLTGLDVAVLYLNGVTVQGNLILDNAKIRKQLTLVGTTIEGNLSLMGSRMYTLDLGGASIKGAISLQKATVIGNLGLAFKPGFGPTSIWVEKERAEAVHYAAPTTPIVSAGVLA